MISRAGIFALPVSVITIFIGSALLLTRDQLRQPFSSVHSKLHEPSSSTPGPRDNHNSSRPDSAARTSIEQAYGKLPMRFETNQGQTDSRVKFLASGSSYSLFLTDDEAVLRLQSAVLRMRLAGANRKPHVSGTERLQTASNYFIGNDPRTWRTNVANYARVKYEAVYPGVDLIWYGKEQQIEHDFVIAPGADPGRIKLSFAGADSMAIDAEGALALRVDDDDVRLLKPVAWQEANGRRREIACNYRISERNQIEFQLGEYDAGQALVIDPVLVYSTYFGGTGVESGLGIAVDESGSAYVCGSTASTDFPAQNGIQPNKGPGSTSDAFVLKLNPGGSSAVYATYLGGGGDDTAFSIAVDAAGAAYVAGETGAPDFPTTAGARQRSLAGANDAFVTKLNPSGTVLVYSTLIGGNNFDRAYGVAVDASGNAYLAGQTDSTDFPTAGSTTSRSGAPLFKSANSAANWNASDNGLTAGFVQAIAIDPANPNNLYIGSTTGVFKSADGGAQWSFAGAAPGASGARPLITTLALDPKTATTVYLGTTAGFFKSVNGGQSFEPKNSGLPATSVSAIAIDPMTTTTIYAGTFSGAYRSADGGESWTPINSGLSDRPPSQGGTLVVRKLVLDPVNRTTLYAGTIRGVFKTADGGANWAPASSGLSSGLPFGPDILALAIDPTNPGTLYAGTLSSGAVAYKTTNGGAGWQRSDNGLRIEINGVNALSPPASFAIDPLAASTVYAGNAQGVFKSVDGGATWSLSSEGVSSRTVTALAVNPANPPILFAGTNIGGDAFVAKLNPSGSSLVYSRYLGGSEFENARGIAVDGAGNAWVTGTTDSSNFPTANPIQPAFAQFGDAFVTKINASGSALIFSSYLGSNISDFGYGIALDGAGAAYVTGYTSGRNFPTVNAIRGNFAGGSFDAFVSKLKADGSALEYSTYLGGAANDFGFAVAVDDGGNAWIAGQTASTDFPSSNTLQPFGGIADAFVTRINPAGSKILYSTFLGGGASDQGNGIAVDASGAAYVTGTTFSGNFPTVNPAQTLKGASDAFIARLGAAADLAVTMTDSPDPATFGADLTYSITVANRGESTATNVRLNDQLPPGSTFVSATPSQGSCGGTSAITCNLGNVNEGASATLIIVIKPPANRSITNTANVVANEPDPNLTNNTATETTTVDFADLTLTKLASHLRIEQGGKLSWILTVKNNGVVNVNNFVVSDNLPAETTFISCTATGGGNCGGSGNNRTATFSTVEAGKTVTAVLSATVNNSTAIGATINNTASINPTFVDSNAADNQAAATTVVGAAAPAERMNGLIAYESQRSGPSELYLSRPDGSGQFRFATGQLPVWSPDGTKLAYLNNGEVRIINADGTGDRKLPTNLPGGFYPPSHPPSHPPSWMPDGMRVLYRGSNGFFLVNIDGSGETKLPFPADFNPGGFLKISPDGTRFLFASRTVNVVNLDGSGLTRITSQPAGNGGDESASWSSDGSKIVFSSSRDTNSTPELYTINVDGTGLRRLTNDNFFDQYPVWSPDGSRIAFVKNSQVFVMNADGSDARQLSNSTDNGRFGVDWQRTPAPALPATYVISGRVVDPEGRSLNVKVELTGTRTATTSLERGGIFAFGLLPAGGDYTVTPVNLNYRFDPPSRSFNNLRSDQEVVFAATYVPMTISGRITDSAGAPIGGVILQLFSQVFSVQATETDADGFYLFNNLLGGFNYTVRPLGYSGMATFNPPSIDFPSLDGNRTGNFTGTREQFTLSGQVTDGSGGATSGATITLDGGGRNTAATTDNEGRYSFANLPGGYVYTLTATKAGTTLAPASRGILLSRPLEINFFSGASVATAASAASFSAQAVATGGIVALFGNNLAASTKAATELPLPVELDGVSVVLNGRNAFERPCQLFFVSPQQINLLIPPSFAPFDAITGEILVTVKRGGSVVAAGSMNVSRVAPALFSANASGQGIAAAVALRVRQDGSQVFEPVARFDAAQNAFVPIPIDLGNPAEQVFLLLFGTGIRYRTALSSVAVKIGGENAPVLFAGDQGGFAGLDQINVQLLRGLAGRGQVDVILTVDGKTANTVSVGIK